MELIARLRAEHDLIEAVAGSFLAFARALRAGRAKREDGPAFIRFLTEYAGRYHHAREEDTLFVALQERANLPDAGPIAALTSDHQRLAALLNEVDRLCTAGVSGSPAGNPPADSQDRRAGLSGPPPGKAGLSGPPCADDTAFEAAVITYVHALWQHIDAENSVLLPESEARLRKHGVRELPSRAATADERAARAAGEALLQRYPPAAETSAERGDGCVCCPLMATTCPGLEQAWWNDWEWEEFEDHLPAG